MGKSYSDKTADAVKHKKVKRRVGHATQVGNLSLIVDLSFQSLGSSDAVVEFERADDFVHHSFYSVPPH